MSKLLGLREWLTIEQTVKYAGTILGENVEAKDLIPIVSESGVVRFSFLPEGKRWYWCKPFEPDDYRFPVEEAVLDDIDREGYLCTKSAKFIPIPHGERYPLAFGQASHASSIIWLESPKTRNRSPAYGITVFEPGVAGPGPCDAVYSTLWDSLFSHQREHYTKAFYVNRVDLEAFLRSGIASTQTIQAKKIPNGQSDSSQFKEHGNTEYISKRRLNVLTAACQVKIHFPDCIENKPASNWAATDWAEALDAKAPLFWPETGKPPLEHSVIVDLLRDAMRKP